jgi:hypothetical protein
MVAVAKLKVTAYTKKRHCPCLELRCLYGFSEAWFILIARQETRADDKAHIIVSWILTKSVMYHFNDCLCNNYINTRAKRSTR